MRSPLDHCYYPRRRRPVYGRGLQSLPEADNFTLVQIRLDFVQRVKGLFFAYLRPQISD